VADAAGGVDKMLGPRKVTPKDFVMDLGSATGAPSSPRHVAARGLGVEYNPDMVALSRRNAIKNGVADRAEFVKADLFETGLQSPGSSRVRLHESARRRRRFADGIGLREQ